MGLPKEKENELIGLKERELRLEILLTTYDSYWVGKELKEIEILLAKKQAIVKRMQISEEKSTDFKSQLLLNKQKQTDIIMQNGLLAKLSKAIELVKGTEDELVS